MNFALRFKQGLAFIKHSYVFMMQNKDLFIIPIISALCTLIFLAAIFFGSVLAGFKDGASQAQFITSIVALVFCYLITPFISLYFNSALTACIIMRLKGQPGTKKEGFALANERIWLIVGWSLITTVIGTILNALENSHNVLEDIIVGILSISWALCSYFVLPILVMEGIGPIAAIKRSTKLFGRNMRMNLGVGLVFMLIFAVILVLGYFLQITIMQNELIIVIPIIVVLMVIVFFFLQQMGTIIRSALYLYNVEKFETSFFDSQLLQGAIVEKRRLWSKKR